MLLADSGAGGADLAGRTLELDVRALAAAALAVASAVAQLPVLGHARGFVHGAVAGAAGVVGLADAPPALAASVSWRDIPKLSAPLGWDSGAAAAAHLHTACCWSGRS